MRKYSLINPKKGKMIIFKTMNRIINRYQNKSRMQMGIYFSPFFFKKKN